MDYTTLLNKLIEKDNLTTKEAKVFLLDVMKGNATPSQISAVLVALRMKGETVPEITGLIQAMRENMVTIHARDAIDVCGTGGDGAGTFNISTAVAFVCTGTGIKVAKHGNRAASSKCGSADVLESLGVNINLTPQQAEKIFNKIGMVFLFAPQYHPSMKQVSMVRKELKIRTVFNFLGPFVSPASVKRQLIGVPDINIAKKLAKVAKRLSYEHLIIATSADGLDEISTSAKTEILEIKNKQVKRYTLDPKKYGFNKSSPGDLLGGTAQENAADIKKIVAGKKGPKRDVVILNSAFALYVSGIAKDITGGIQRAEQSIDTGQAKLILEKLIKETNKYA